MSSEYFESVFIKEGIASDFDPIKFWCRHTTLYTELKDIATKYLIACGSSVSSEHVFSSTGCLLDDYHTQISSSNVNKITFI